VILLSRKMCDSFFQRIVVPECLNDMKEFMMLRY